MHTTTRCKHKHGEGAPNIRSGDRRSDAERRHAIMIDCYEHEHKHEHKREPIIGVLHARTGHRRSDGERRHAAMMACYKHKQKTRPLTMIECTICKHAAYSSVEYAESEALINGGRVSRPCHHCGITTMWKQFDLPASANMGWSTSN